ncbi:uncharacterized protein LOC114525110 [Dendronephthya gigantea]|uniref:uncharacterized protein LOC114525110 n=1 Tax=Dendronephthya gigantea TaxID=151771 RepID=UPI0010695333|nr:uncharacterized protein LOC114525110 [Dendronephthya gigantea]
MDPEEGYLKAKKLLKDNYGQNYKIAAAYVDRITQASPIKAEDGVGLQKYSVLLASCRNTLKEIGYISRVENPEKRVPSGRLKFVRKRGLCDNCLFQGHVAKSCPKPSFCKVAGCQFKHSTYLHPRSGDSGVDKSCGPDSPNESTDRSGDEGCANNGARNGCVSATQTECGVIGAGVSTTGLPLVPVKVKCAGSFRVVLTYAFLDPGSNTTFCSNELLEQLGITGKKTTLSLTTLQNVQQTTRCSVTSLEVWDLNEENLVELPTVFSTERLPVDRSSIPLQKDVDRWPHLRNVNVQEIDAAVGLLIGNDVPKALEPKEVRESSGAGPYAVRTVFGWTINGPLGRNKTARRCANFIRSDHDLNEQFQTFCNMEFNDSVYDTKLEMSVEDSRALGMMEGSVQLKDGHYEVALPWKNFPPRLPNNRPLAEHRLNLLKKRLLKDPQLLSKYSEFMDNMLSRKYARKVPESSITQPKLPLWYLPHHPVINSNKPSKIRVVFDCAAVFRGTSLNSQLLQGPDLTNSLVGVLIRFRTDPVALMADIEAMFHQVRVTPSDYDALRFLWWHQNDLDKNPKNSR